MHFFFYWALSFELCHSDIAYSSIMEKFEGKSQSNFSKLGWEKFPLLIFIFSPTSKEIKKKPRKKLVAGFKVISRSLQSDLWWKVCQTKAFQQHSAAELSKFKPALHQHTTYQWNAHQREQIMFRISLSYLNHNKRLYESMYNEHLIFYPTSLHLFSFLMLGCSDQVEKTSDTTRNFSVKHSILTWLSRWEVQIRESSFIKQE